MLVELHLLPFSFYPTGVKCLSGVHVDRLTQPNSKESRCKRTELFGCFQSVSTKLLIFLELTLDAMREPSLLSAHLHS